MNLSDVKDVLVDQRELLSELDQGQRYLLRKISELHSPPDYSKQLSQIQALLDKASSFIELKNEFSVVADNCSRLLLTVQQLSKTQHELIESLPRRIRVDTQHRVDNKQRPYLMAAFSLILMAAASIGYGIYKRAENDALKENDFKMRYVILENPSWTQFIDSVYSSNADHFRDWVERQERRVEEISRAQREAEISEQRAEQAKQELEKTKSK